jgi:AcrR family transcriptional regulator
MDTKEKIIQAAIKLFNRNGITDVTIRQIAAEVGISHGNLAYHYKNKGRILNEIYTRMDREMSDAVFPEGKSNLSLKHYHNLLQRISDFQKRHRFFYMDMLEIRRRYPAVINRYRKTVAIRSRQYSKLISVFIEKGLVKKEPEPGFYESLFHSIWVMSTFWLQQKKILGKNHTLIKSGSGVKRVWEILLPHLTERGLKKYKAIAEPNMVNHSAGPIQKVYLSNLSDSKRDST